MSRSAHDRLRSAAEAARLIVDRSSGRTFNDYLTDPAMRAMIERWLEKIGEALVQAQRTLPVLDLAIPDIYAISGLRNRIAHDYDDLDADIIWAAVTHNVPRLIPVLDELGSMSESELVRRYGNNAGSG